MSVSLEYLEKYSAETGFQLEPLEKVVRLGELAAHVTRDRFLGSALALKGGTLLNLCYGPPKRLSVDLDFNYIRRVQREKMLADRPRVESAVTALAQRAGYRVQSSPDTFASRKLYLAYRSAMGHEDRIEVDLNFLFRLPLADTASRALWQPGELDRPKVRSVGDAELLVGKLLALLDRGAARDVWDVANLPQRLVDVLESNEFRVYFIALVAILNHPPSSYTRDRLERLVDERSIVDHLTPLLGPISPPNLDDLVKRAWAVLDPLLSLQPHEEAYLNAINNGELRLELILPEDAEMASRLALHPAIMWKVSNVRDFIARKGPRSKKGGSS